MTTCTYGGHRIDGTTMRPNYCGQPATGTSRLGSPRCDEHRAHRYLVWAGSSLTLTQVEHDNERDACGEVMARLAASHGWRVPEDRRRERMTAKPATADDIARFEVLAEQSKASRRDIKAALSS